LRGSRSNTIWGVFWAVGIIHFWVRPLSKRMVLAGVCLLVAFMYLYGFYKALGRDVLTVYEQGTLSELGEKLDRTFEGLVLGDLGRSDVQAFLLYRLSMPGRDYTYAWGRTYLGTLAPGVSGAPGGGKCFSYQAIERFKLSTTCPASRIPWPSRG